MFQVSSHIIISFLFFFALLQNLKLLRVLYEIKLYSYLFYFTYVDFFNGLAFTF